MFDSRKNIFRFSGKTDEFFRIWIPNLLLSILTLGIYAAWAKIKTRKYFYANTWLRHDNFSYTASPKDLIGWRIMAALFVIMFIVALKINVYVAITLLVLLLCVLPWGVVTSLRYNARATAYQNIGFDFVGDYGQAYLLFLGLPLLLLDIVVGLILFINYLVPYPEVAVFLYAIISLAFFVLLAYMTKYILYYIISNYRYGKQAFKVDFEIADIIGDYMRLAVLLFLLAVSVFTVTYAAFYLTGFLATIENKCAGFSHCPRAISTLWIASFLLSFWILYSFIKSILANMIYRQTSLGKDKFHTSYKFLSLLWIHLTYGTLVILTFGFAWPWLKIKRAEYLANNTIVVK